MGAAGSKKDTAWVAGAAGLNPEPERVTIPPPSGSEAGEEAVTARVTMAPRALCVLEVSVPGAVAVEAVPRGETETETERERVGACRDVCVQVTGDRRGRSTCRGASVGRPREGLRDKRENV